MDNYTDKYLKYKNKYLELKQQLEQNGGSLYDVSALVDTPLKDLKKLSEDLKPKSTITREDVAALPDFRKSTETKKTTHETSTPKTTTTKTVNNTYLYSPYLDPLVSYALPGHKYYTKSYLDPYYTTNVYSPYTYYKSSYRDPYADDYYYEEEKPKRRSKRTSKKKSKKTSKKKSKRKTSKKSKRKSKRRSRK